jgi:hypothetical protein
VTESPIEPPAPSASGTSDAGGAGAFAEADVVHALERADGRFATLLVRQLTEQMLLAARELGVDYESLVILGALASRAPSAAVPGGGAGTGGRADRRVSDLAAATGIPRETVRRRLIALERSGRVARVPFGWVASGALLGPAQRDYAHAAVRSLLSAASDLRIALENAREAAAAGAAPGEVAAGRIRS